MLLEVCDDVIIDRAILNEVSAGEKVSSPGMKYKHYSPKADIIMAEGSAEKLAEYVRLHDGENIYSLVYTGDEKYFSHRCLTYGADSSEQAHLLFKRLRELDGTGAEKVYVRAPSAEGVGLAVYNRLIRAAGFEVIKL